MVIFPPAASEKVVLAAPPKASDWLEGMVIVWAAPAVLAILSPKTAPALGWTLKERVVGPEIETVLLSFEVPIPVPDIGESGWRKLSLQVLGPTKVGVVRLALVSKTTRPVPTGSEILENHWALVALE